jgi:hypothetical protein
VAWWNQTRHYQIFLGDECAADQLVARDHHIIVGVEPDNGRGGLDSLILHTRILQGSLFTEVHIDGLLKVEGKAVG